MKINRIWYWLKRQFEAPVIPCRICGSTTRPKHGYGVRLEDEGLIETPCVECYNKPQTHFLGVRIAHNDGTPLKQFAKSMRPALTRDEWPDTLDD